MLFGSAFMLAGGGGGVMPVELTISADTYNYNIFTEAGSPSGPVAVTLTIDAGVKVGSTTSAAAAIDTGALPDGSTLAILNSGRIQGKGGDGNSGPAGDALNLQCDATITNSGEIWGGGGGGGWAMNSFGPGGGGAGDVPGAAGDPNPSETAGWIAAGAGTTESGGAGGRTGEAAYAWGGAGGAPGAAGSYGAGWKSYSGGAGGAAGKAIALNSYSVTWVSGSGAPNVKGAVA